MWRSKPHSPVTYLVTDAVGRIPAADVTVEPGMRIRARSDERRDLIATWDEPRGYYPCWPVRLFEIRDADILRPADHLLHQPHLCRAVTVDREIEAWRAFGPNGRIILRLIEQARSLDDELVRRFLPWSQERQRFRMKIETDLWYRGGMPEPGATLWAAFAAGHSLHEAAYESPDAYAIVDHTDPEYPDHRIASLMIGDEAWGCATEALVAASIGYAARPGLAPADYEALIHDWVAVMGDPETDAPAGPRSLRVSGEPTYRRAEHDAKGLTEGATAVPPLDAGLDAGLDAALYQRLMDGYAADVGLTLRETDTGLVIEGSQRQAE